MVHADARGEGDQLPTILAPFFAAGKVDEAALHCSPHIKQLSEGAGLATTLSAASFKRMGGSTETFRLAAGVCCVLLVKRKLLGEVLSLLESHRVLHIVCWCAGASGPVNDRVNLYLDEVGALKKLPGNRRASALASLCGFGSGVPFFGDMFAGRVRTRAGRVCNVDFVLDDTRPESAWLRVAAAQNRAQQQQEAPFRGAGATAEELRNVSGEGEGYTWEQEDDEVVVTVPVPVGTRGKHCKIAISKRSVSVALTSTAPGFKELQLPLYAPVVASDSMWSLDGNNVVLTLVKSSEDEIWPALICSTS